MFCNLLKPALFAAKHLPARTSRFSLSFCSSGGASDNPTHGVSNSESLLNCCTGAIFTGIQMNMSDTTLFAVKWARGTRE